MGGTASDRWRVDTEPNREAKVDTPDMKLDIDQWWKALVIMGGVTAVIGLTGHATAFPDRPVTVLGAGLFFVGLGEWISHPKRAATVPATASVGAHVVTGNPWEWSFQGVVSELLGIILVVAATRDLLR